MVNKDDEETWMRQVMDRHGLDRDCESERESDSDSDSSSSSSSGSSSSNSRSTDTINSSEKSRNGKDNTSLEGITNNDSSDMAVRLSLRFKELRKRNQYSCSHPKSANLEIQDSIPSTLYLYPQNNPSPDDFDESALFEIAQKQLVSSMFKSLSALDELRAELDVLLALDESTSEAESMIERLRSVLQVAPALEIHFRQILRPLLDEDWLPIICKESYSSTVCRLAFIVNAIARFFSRYLVKLGQRKSCQRSGGYNGGIWDIRSYVVSSTLVALLEHEMAALMTLLEVSLSEHTTIYGPSSIEYHMSEDFQTALQESGHNGALHILLEMYARQNVQDISKIAPKFRKVCRDVLISMDSACPIDPEALLHLCTEDPRVWHELLESHLHNRRSSRSEANILDLKGVTNIDSAKGLAPMPKEARNALEKIPGPLLLRREALESTLRRIVPPNMSGSTNGTCYQASWSTINSCLKFSVEDEEASISNESTWCDSQARVAAVVSSSKAVISKGMGKTTLAALAVHCPEVRTFYKDGIVWLSLNGLRACDLSYARYRKLLEDVVQQIEESEILVASRDHHLNKKAILLPDHIPSHYGSAGDSSMLTRQKYNNRHQELGLMTYACSLMVDFVRDKKVLLVLDDVADVGVLEWFQFSSGSVETGLLEGFRRSGASKRPAKDSGVFTLLATTDNNSLLPAAAMVEIDEVSTDDAISLMNLQTFCLSSMDSKQLVQTIVHACSHHPLAISCIRRLLDLVDAHGVEEENDLKLRCLQRLYEAILANCCDILKQLLYFSLQPDILCTEESGGDAKAGSFRLKTCFVGFVVIFCHDPSENNPLRPLISEDAVDCLFRCLLSLGCINGYSRLSEAKDEDEAVSIRHRLVRLGILQVVNRDGGIESKSCPTITETDTGSHDVRLMHAIYREYAYSLVREDSSLRQVLNEIICQSWNRAFASFLFLSLASLPLGDKCIADERDQRHMYKEWETTAPVQTPLLEYGLRRLPMHLMRAELYDEAIDLLGSNRFAYDRVIHQCGTREGIQSVVEQHLHNVSYLMANLSPSYDRKTILRQIYLPLGNQLMQVLEDCSYRPAHDIDGDEKKTEEPELQPAEPNKDERVKEVAKAFTLFGRSLVEYHFYEPAIKFWRTSCETLASYHGTKNVVTVAAILQNMGTVYRDSLHDYDKAIECLTDCLAIRRSIYGDNHIISAQTLRYLSVCFIGIGTFDDAKTALSLALNMLAHKPRLYREEIAEIQTCMGSLHCKFLDYELALECFQKALLNWAAEHGEESEHLAFIYEQIGRCQFELGSYESASESISKAQELLNLCVGEKKDHDATVLNLQGIRSYIVGCHDESLGHYKKAVVLYREMLSSDIRETTTRSSYLEHRLASTLNDIGRVYLQLSINSEALRYFDESLEARSIDSASHRRDYRLSNILEAADTLFSMSKAYERQGQLGNALSSLGESLKIRDKFCPDSEVLALTYLKIASVARSKRDSTKAQAALQAALDIRRKLHNGDERHNAVVVVLDELHKLIDEIW